jgi:hypothetical protein
MRGAIDRLFTRIFLHFANDWLASVIRQDAPRETACLALSQRVHGPMVAVGSAANHGILRPRPGLPGLKSSL